MIDLVYVLGTGSRWQDHEIGNSMRSVRKFVSNVRRIVVVGELPQTPTRVPFSYIPALDSHANKQHNVRDKLLRAANESAVSQRFMLMNDDFFFLKPMDAAAFPTYRMGLLADHIKWRMECPNTYLHALQWTRDQLEASGLPTVDFEVHCPILYDKDKLKEVIDYFDWEGMKKPLLRSLYGNFLKLDGTLVSDCKIEEPLKRAEILRRLGDRNFFSIGDGGLQAGGDLKELLKEMYP